MDFTLNTRTNKYSQAKSYRLLSFTIFGFYTIANARTLFWRRKESILLFPTISTLNQQFRYVRDLPTFGASNKSESLESFILAKCKATVSIPFKSLLASADIESYNKKVKSLRFFFKNSHSTTHKNISCCFYSSSE